MTEEADDGSDEQSFRERVEEIREQRAEEGEAGGNPLGGGEPMSGMMGGGNPFAQMMGGMMGGGGGGELNAAPIVRELEQLREELESTNDHLEAIASSLRDD